MVFTLTTDGNQLFENGVNVNPVGSVICYAGQTEPAGWLFCNGTQVLKSDYPQLYAVITNTYGTASNSDYFVLPNLREKIPMGNSGETGFSLGNSGGNKNITLGVNQLPSHSHGGTTNESGVHSHTGSTSTDGTHSHSINDPGHTHTQTTINDDFNNSGSNPPGFSADSAGVRVWNNISTNTTGISIDNGGAHSHTILTNNSSSHTHTFTTSTTGSGDSVNILNPYLILNYIIKT